MTVHAMILQLVLSGGCIGCCALPIALALVLIQAMVLPHILQSSLPSKCF